MTYSLLLHLTQRQKPMLTCLIGLLLTLFMLSPGRPALAQDIPFVLHDSTAEADFTTSMAWGDYDNDGDLDLVVGNGMLTREEMLAALDVNKLTIQCRNDLSGRVTGLLNGYKAQLTQAIRAQIEGIKLYNDRQTRLYRNEKGHLLPQWRSEENDFTIGVAWGDADGDGDLDLAVGNNSLGLLVDLRLQNPVLEIQCEIRSAAPGAANYVYRNDSEANGAPNFTLAWVSPEEDGTTSVAWGDYDNDGRLDLAVANSQHYIVVNVVIDPQTLDEIITLLQSGEMAEVTEKIRKTVRPPTYVSEPQPSRVYHNDTLTNSLDSSLVFSLEPAFPALNETSFSVAWVDVNHDQQLDLAFANAGPERVYCNFPAATRRRFQSCWQSTINDLSTSQSWGDVDGNGLPDLAIGNIRQIRQGEVNRLYLNLTPTDTNPLSTTVVFSEPWTSDEKDGTLSVAFGDADGDGDLDLAVGNGNFDANQPNRIYCNENRRLIPTACWSAPEADITTSIAWGDMDGDGDLDLAIGNISVPVGQQNRFYRNDSAQLSSTFAAWRAPNRGYTRDIAWADVDGDHNLDLTLGNEGVEQIFMTAHGSVTITPTLFMTDDATSSLAWGDMDNDHKLDLVVGNELGTPNRLYRNVTPTALLMGSITTTRVSTPTFELVWEFGAGVGTASVAWGDMDGDGDLDLALGNSSYTPLDILVGERNQIYRNDGMVAGKPSFVLVWESTEEDATRSVAWGDVDSDGDLDLAVGNSATPNRIYRNDGAQTPGQMNFNPAWDAPQINDTHSVAWGDMDGDGDLDLAVGNTTQSSRVYCNQSDAKLDHKLILEECWQSIEGERTRSVAWGDMDGDGDLDLALGNQEAPEQLYVNIGKTLSRTPIWVSQEVGTLINGVDRSWTWSVAWGDADGDGDLDLAVGNSENERSGVYLNQGRNHPRPQDPQPFSQVFTPGQTPGAPFFATAEILRATTPVLIPYRLFTNGQSVSDPSTMVRILPEYSLNGGGLWLPATPGAGGDGTTDLSASAWPKGTDHIFAWDADKDLIKSDQVIFRIRTQTAQTHSPILWPATGSQSPPFRVEASWYVHVIDTKGQSVANAEVYADGKFITYTNSAGLVGPQVIPPEQRKNLVALAPQREQAAVRGSHPDGWSYRIYQTSLTWQDSITDSVALPYTPTPDGEQRLTTSITMPLVLFNLVVSLEWAADITDTKEISVAMRQASDYLYDLTDGQMAFGRVTIYTNAQHWTEADIQVAAKNTVHPYAYIGGITSTVSSQVIHIGRAWNGDQGNDGEWSAVNGFRTITHEFGHYALHLYDEYFGYLSGTNALNPNIQCIGNRDWTKQAFTASAMDYQYTNSELSDQHLSQLWQAKCERVAQYQRTNGQSAWETLVAHYQDTDKEARWLFLKPSDRGKVIEGPLKPPNGAPQWPHITISGAGLVGPKLALTVRNAAGPFPDAGVTLYKATGSVAIDQGRTTKEGHLMVYGVGIGDTLFASSINGALAGNLTITNTNSATLTLSPIHKPFAALFRELLTTVQAPTPYLRIVPDVVPTVQDQLTLTYWAQNFDPPSASQSALTVIVTEPGQATARFAQAAYRTEEQRYSGQLHFADTPSANNVQVIGAVANDIYYLHASYQVQRVNNLEPQLVFSGDGRVRLDFNRESFPGSTTYVVINSQNASPGPISTTLTLVGSIYDITASGSAPTLQQPAALTIQYDPEVIAPEALSALGLYEWNATTQQWERVADTIAEPDRHALSASITRLGAYAVMAEQ